MLVCDSGSKSQTSTSTSSVFPTEQKMLLSYRDMEKQSHQFPNVQKAIRLTSAAVGSRTAVRGPMVAHISPIDFCILGCLVAFVENKHSCYSQ